MIKKLISKLFLSEKKRNKIVKDLKQNPSFRAKEEIEKRENTSNINSDFTLDKGKVQSILTPDLGNQKGLTLTKWHIQLGDTVKHGDIICNIENENITMEFESFLNGRIISICKLNEKLVSGTEICKIQGT
ncbi:lipoyl domain-containing protein [Tenacibaculum ovolyticum]|uniref:lipoyl domain-containing protein n=1 Tax=Tenacibaculum ovolyticum TaxID=104270 RepID=UPI0007EC59BF|nr:lipoyl domain-containing protein [Tenacibaculum ovolyticum]